MAITELRARERGVGGLALRDPVGRWFYPGSVSDSGSTSELGRPVYCTGDRDRDTDTGVITSGEEGKGENYGEI